MESTTTQVVLKGDSSSNSPVVSTSAYFVKVNPHHAVGLSNSNNSSGRDQSNIMWHLCSGDASDGQDPQHMQRENSRYVVSQNNDGTGEIQQPLFSLLLSSIQQLQNRMDSRFDQLERRLTSMERILSNLQKQQAIVAKKRKRCVPPNLPLNDTKSFIHVGTSFNGNVSSNNVPCINDSVAHVSLPSTSIVSEAAFVSSCSSKTLSEFMKSAQLESIPCLKGHCVTTDNGYVVSNVVDGSGNVCSLKFPVTLVERILKDNPPEPSGWSASKALVTLLDYIYHPLEMAMRRLPALPASNSLASNLQGRQRSELFVGTQYEDGIPFSADRLLPCCKVIEHYYPGWRFKAFEKNHAFREIVHKKCRTRRRDLKQYLQQCNKTKEQVLDMIIKGIDLPPRDFLLK